MVNELSVFASWPQAFTFDELLYYADHGVDQKTIRSALLESPPFIRLSSKSPDEDRFISDSELFKWFSNLNIRLSQVGQFKLTEHQLTTLINNLRRQGRWEVPPKEAILFGQSVGFIGQSYKPGQYVFPLARILSFLTPFLTSVTIDVLKDLGENQRWKLPLKKLLNESLQEGFAQFSKNVTQIIQAREGLLTGQKQTLAKIGTSLGCTRERIRQVEEKFWNSLKRQNKRRPFLCALILDFMDKSGSLIVSISSSELQIRKFLAKCGGIPCVELSKIRLLIIGVLPKNISLKSSKWPIDEIDPDAQKNKLESDPQLSFVDRDVKVLGESMAQFHLKTLGQAQRVYIALRTIGRPAHYSKVTEIYHSLFPNQPATEHNVHAILSHEQYGIVWIGVRGTYALKEWGYERPSKTLFETVAEIVEIFYKRTGKPVPFTIIMTEIGKYRKITNVASLTIAAHFNPNLRCVSKNSFMPKGPNDQAQDEVSVDQLDKILQEFSKSSEKSLSLSI